MGLPTQLRGDLDDAFATLCKALGHPVRVKLIRLLIKNGECISGDLAHHFSLAQSTVSEHLRLLKVAGLVQGVIDGQKRCYCIHPAALSLLKELVKEL